MNDENPGNIPEKPPCKYGTQCYRRNKDHLEKFEHAEESEDKTQPAAKKLRGTLKQKKLSSFFSSSSKKLETKIQGDADRTNGTDRSDLRENDTPSTLKNELVEESNSGNIPSSTVVSNKDHWQLMIKKLFLVDMPDDFFSLWEFCKSISPENPHNALTGINLQLVGPFNVLDGSMTDDIESSVACRHWRYFYDPPEFQTVLKSDGSDLLHFGYYRYDPKELPVFVGYNRAAKDAIITAVGENIFAAIDWYLSHPQNNDSPFLKMNVSSLKNKLHGWAKTHSYSLRKYTESMGQRDSKVVAKTFHNAGIVVPYDKKTELGYRPLATTSAELIKIVDQVENNEDDNQRKFYLNKLHEVITWANIAVDESDFGTALELGINLFCFDSKRFDNMILQLLPSTYRLLQRDIFATIIEKHVKHRKKGDNLSVLESNRKKEIDRNSSDDVHD